MASKPLLSIGIPTYNEKENIYNLIYEIGRSLESSNINVHINIIDDSSPDGTADYIRRSTKILQEQYPFMKINLFVREGKLGLASAHVYGFKQAFSQDADYIMEMDADFSHQPKYIPIFLDAIKDYDLVIGSRYVRGGGTTKWNFFRKFLSVGGSLYARTILGMKIQDMTAGFKMYRGYILQSIDLDQIKSTGYSFQIELKYRIFKRGFKIKEVPIIFPDREKGKSKMDKFQTIINTIFVVWKLKFDKSI